MAKQIEIELDGKKYTLEYNRNGIRKAETVGLDFSNLGKVITTPTTLFYGALVKHHPEITLEKSDELYDEIADEELVKELSGMAMACIEKMYEEKSKNGKWKVVK